MMTFIAVTLAFVIGVANDGDAGPKYRPWHESEQAVDTFVVAYIYCMTCGGGKS